MDHSRNRHKAGERCVLGLSPKAPGALALCSADTQQAVEVRDMPVVETAAGSQREPALDVPEILRLFQAYTERFDLLLALMERWDGAFCRAKHTAFAAGYAQGVFHAAFLNAGIPLQQVRSPDWKRQLYIPGRNAPLKIYKNRVMLRVSDHFENSDLFYDDGGYFSVHRAEAALIAHFGIQRYFPNSP